MLHWKRQEKNWGCIWHAAYAVTGDEGLLDFVSEICPMNYRIRLIERGHLLEAIYNDLYERAVEPDFWERLDDRWYGAKYILDVPSLKHPGLRHMVALGLGENGQMMISDSSAEADGTQVFSREEFIKSPYARPCTVFAIYSSRLDDWPSEDAEACFTRMKAQQEAAD